MKHLQCNDVMKTISGPAVAAATACGLAQVICRFVTVLGGAQCDIAL